MRSRWRGERGAVCVALLLFVGVDALTVTRRSLLDPFDEASSAVAQDTSPGTAADKSRGRKAFVSLKDTVGASSAQAQSLYEQASSGASIAYALFAAAQPLSRVPGSTTALLPYLTPVVLRLYLSQPSRCATGMAAELYDLSYDLAGTKALQAGQYVLHNSLRSTFSWVADNVPMRVEAVPEQLLADAAWPDVEPGELLNAVKAALTDPGQLGVVAEAVETALGLSADDFAALIPRVAEALETLHRDLPTLQRVAETVHASRWEKDRESDWLSRRPKPREQDDSASSDNSGSSGSHRRAALEGWRARVERAVRRRGLSAQHSMDLGSGISAAEKTAKPMDFQDNQTFGHAGRELSAHEEEAVDEALLASVDDTNGDGTVAAGEEHKLSRRSLLIPSNYDFSYPPSFVAAPPGQMPLVRLPIVFHILLYSDVGGGVGPANYNKAADYVNRMVRIANTMAKPSNFQFFVQEVRNDASRYPYLLQSSRSAWLSCPNGGADGQSCMASNDWLQNNVATFPRFLNVFVASDSSAAADVPLGYAFVPGSDTYPLHGHVFLTWDSLSADGFNSPASYNDGPNTLLHEAFHHLGLLHPWGPTNDQDNSCADDDYVIDTPTTLGSAGSSSFASTATAYCMELFWGTYGGDWEATFTRWATQPLGVPAGDMNAWADSCPNNPGYDELGNYMTYNTPVCFAAVGHLTLAQAQRAHLITAELNPVLYAWGQWYAQNQVSPPPMASPPPEAYNNICKNTATSWCACKASWTKGSGTYSYCDRTGTSNSLECEVANPASCPDCPATGTCVLPCTGTARQCKRSLAPGSVMPPPPPPRSPPPPPHPPPPPPRSVPAECMKAANGCNCRRTWFYMELFVSYCASPDNDAQLWCEVTPDCPTYDIDNPYEYCPKSLTLATCGGPIHFSTTERLPPSPPAGLARPPPPSSTSPTGSGTGNPASGAPAPAPSNATSDSPTGAAPAPAPPAGPVANLNASLTVNANCSRLTDPSFLSLFLEDLQRDLANAFKVEIFAVIMGKPRCGSIITPYTVQFPQGTNATQLADARKLASSDPALLVSPSFATAYGAPTNASADSVVVLQPSVVCPPGTPISAICPASPPPPPPFPPPPSAEKKKGIPLAIIIGAAAGGAALIAILVLIIVLAVRKPRGPAKNAVQPQHPGQQVVQGYPAARRGQVAPAPYPPSPGAQQGYAPSPQQPYPQQQYPQQQYPQQYPQAGPAGGVRAPAGTGAGMGPQGPVPAGGGGGHYPAAHFRPPGGYDNAGYGPASGYGYQPQSPYRPYHY